MKRCAYCNARFQAKDSRTRHCSKECGQRSRGHPDRRCPDCQERAVAPFDSYCKPCRSRRSLEYKRRNKQLPEVQMGGK